MANGTVWERQPGETAMAYAAFRTYRDMNPGVRTIVAAQATVKGASRASWEDWSAANHWKERTKAFDAWVDTIRRDERERGFRDEERLKFQRRRELLEKEQNIADRALMRINEALSAPMFRKTIKDTDTATITIIEPTRWTFRDLTAAFTLIDRRARLTLEMSGDPARAPTPEPEAKGTSDVESYIQSMLEEAQREGDAVSAEADDA